MLEVRLLGTFEVKHKQKPITIASRPAQSLFAYLILHAGTAHRREQLAGRGRTLWKEWHEITFAMLSGECVKPWNRSPQLVFCASTTRRLLLNHMFLLQHGQ